MASSYLPWDRLPNSKYSQNGDGVEFFMQFPRNYLQPYGQAKSIPDQNTILRRLKHFCCEWLKRPKTAASELYSSIAENLVLLLDADNCIGKEEIANVAQCHEMMDFLRNASMFHRFAEPKGGMPEAKKLVEHLLQQNERLDNFFSRAFLMGNALFTMATHWFVARTLMGNPDELAAKMEVPGHLAAKFKWSRNLMDFLPLIAYQSISNMGARNENIAHILAQLGVPDKQNQVEEEAGKLKKAKKARKKEMRKRCQMEGRSEEDRADEDKRELKEEEAQQLKRSRKQKNKEKRKRFESEGRIVEENEDEDKRELKEEEAQQLKRSRKLKREEKRKRFRSAGRIVEENEDEDKRALKEEEARQLKRLRKLKRKEKREVYESKGRNEEKKEGKERTEEEADKLEKSKKLKRTEKRKRFYQNEDGRKQTNDKEEIKAKKVKKEHVCKV